MSKAEEYSIKGGNVLLFGAPGTGKGTQAGFLKSRFGFCHISTGDLFRQAMRAKNPLGLKVKSYMDQGDLVPDSLVVDLIRNTLQNKAAFKNKVILWDGFPRTVGQARALDRLFEELGEVLDCVLYLRVEESLLCKRLVGRRVAPQSGRVYHVQFKPPGREGFCDKSGEALVHRADDHLPVVQSRLKTYFQQTAPLIDYYHKQGLLKELDGSLGEGDVFSQICEVLGLKTSHSAHSSKKP